MHIISARESLWRPCVRTVRISGPHEGEIHMLKKLLIMSAAGACCWRRANSSRQPAPPPAAPRAQGFSVYFDTGQSALSSEASATVAQAAASYKQDGRAVAVRGHADTVGNSRSSTCSLLATRCARRHREVGRPAGQRRHRGRLDPGRRRRRADLACQSRPPKTSPSGSIAPSVLSSRGRRS